MKGSDFMKWINYEKERPKKNGEYMVVKSFSGYRKIDVVRYALDLTKVDDYTFTKHRPGWYEWDDEYGYYERRNITHWSELPPLPEEEKEGYVDAAIRLKVPEWQIGQEATVYFRDTMIKNGICENE